MERSKILYATLIVTEPLLPAVLALDVRTPCIPAAYKMFDG